MPKTHTETISVETTASPSKKWRSVLSLLFIIFWVPFCVATYGVVQLFAPKRIDHVYKLFHKGCCWAFGLELAIKGDIATKRPILFLANHISYLDVFLLGSVLPAYFIAKSEVASWPILGPLAKIQNTLFFERRGVRIREQLEVMSGHFNDNGNLILFPEGTSTEGEHVEPFKSSLLQSVEMADTDVLIQPVTIAYTHHDNQVMSRAVRDHYAWYATMPFAPHFFSALGMGKARVSLQFHPPVSIKSFETRKDCANYCFAKVASNLANVIQNPT